MMSGTLQKVLHYIIVFLNTDKQYIPQFNLHLGFRKKLEALAKQKECELVGQWQRSIINHMYWCVKNCETCISQDDIEVPQPLCSQYERPEKMFTVEQHRSRFNL